MTTTGNDESSADANARMITPPSGGGGDDAPPPFDPNAGRRLLSSTYRQFDVQDLGDRYVAFLLRNERTAAALQGQVVADHWAIVRRMGGEAGYGGGGGFGGEDATIMGMGGMQGGADMAEARGRRGRASSSIEIDAFQLLSLDPVLGNLTLRYPDTLLVLLEDSTVDARKVLRGRIEAALQASLEGMKRNKPDMGVKNDDFKREVNRMHALLQALRHTKRQEGGYDPRPLHARLVRLPPHSQFCKPTLSSISAADVGTVVQLCGTCVRTGPVRMMEAVRTYQCLGRGCGHVFSMNAEFGTANNALPPPVICPLSSIMDGEPCLSANFAVVPDGSERTDYQEMKVQESASALNRVGSVPRSILVKLTDDLVDVCNPGDEVVVVGELHAAWGNQTPGMNVECMVGMSLKAHSVRVINIDEEAAGVSGSSSGLGFVSGEGASGNLREKFRREFDAFWNDAVAVQRPIATRDYIVRAICPKLFGMHAVKLGLLLVMIGGAAVSSMEGGADDTEGGNDGQSEKEGAIEIDSDDEAPVAFQIGGDGDDYNSPKKESKKAKTSTKRPNKGMRAIKSRRRIQSHILLIGDPGTGKSQFLRFAAALSPRSVLTTGTGSSRAGLTCAAVRDSSSAGSNGNEFSLEAGALALADRGVCCIDEFGCMSKEDRTSIHEAMEQLTISVAKAGIICKLNARATVVAVMNPNGGIYDDSLSLEQNSRLGSALLSRFDLVFKMMDQAETNRDASIAHFLLQQSIIPGSGYDRPLEMEALSNDDSANGHWQMEKLRAYIATIREKFHPTLTPEASDLLQSHYSMCRQKSMNRRDGSQSPGGQSLITVRFLESLIRLSQAHARLMYRDKVELDDAVTVILLMECTAASGMFEGFNPDFDDLHKNPIDSLFLPFDKADEAFEKEKNELLGRYQGRQSRPDNHRRDWRGNGGRSWDDVEQHSRMYSRPTFEYSDQGGDEFRDQYNRPIMSQSQGVASPHPSFAHGDRGGNEQRDQYDRPVSMSQAASPYPPSQRNSMNGNDAQRSAKKVSFSQAPDDAYQYDDGYQNQQNLSQHHEREARVNTQQWGGHGQMLPSQQIDQYAPSEEHMSQSSTGSGRRRKKRRSAD
ncbi:hypothetical protein ACHAXT_011410 [Thalassiosira profunda]